MSAKQLRKLQERQAEEAEADDGEEEADAGASDLPAASRQQAKPSCFALLADDDSEDDADETPQQPVFSPPSRGSGGGGDSGGGAKAAPQAAKVAATAEDGKKGKKKKKKGRGAKQGAANALGVGGGEQGDDGAADEDDDALLDRLAAAGAAEDPSRGGAGSGGAAAAAAQTPVACVLAMSRPDFSAEREHRRVFGDAAAAVAFSADGDERRAASAVGIDLRGTRVARRAHESRFVHHRKLFLVTPTPEEPWPRPEGCAEMVAGARNDGTPAFKVRTTPAHTRARLEFAAAQLTHDPNEIGHFVVERPFCVEALVLLAEIYRSGGEHEAASQLVRRAAYAVECGFEAGFSPFAQSGAGPSPSWPRVSLELPAAGEEEAVWPGWPWLAALSTYMLSLYTQGLNRTAIEVCKLLLAAMLPRDPLHILVRLDVMCLRAHQYDLLLQISSHLCGQMPLDSQGLFRSLDCALPNFAYSVALARRLASGAAADLTGLNLVSVNDVLPPESQQSPEGMGGPEDPSLLPHAALMRALLLFPQALQPLLDVASVKLDAPPPSRSPSRKSWRDLFAAPPFLRFGDFRHKKHFLAHALIADAYAITCGQLWRSESTLTWLHACAARLAQMHESSLFASELTAARREWSQAELGMDRALRDYADFSTAEVGQERKTAPVIQRAMEAHLREAEAAMREQMGAAGMGPGFALGGGGGGAEDGAQDEEAMLQRVLRLSRNEEESRQRRSLVEQQDAEFQESLAADRARDASGEEQANGGHGASAEQPLASSGDIAELVAMGFSASDAARALRQTGGDPSAAVAVLLG